MNYVIVKNAQDVVWKHYFDSDPNLGVHKSYSAHDTFTGQQCNILGSYVTKDKAQEDCKKMLDMNPCGYYDVCFVAV